MNCIKPHKPQDFQSPFCWNFFNVRTEGGQQRGGRKQMRAKANKRRQTLTNASKRGGENASKRMQTRANVDKLGDHQPYTTTTKDFQSKKGYFEGVVYELSEPKRRAKDTPPPGLHKRCSTWFCGGGARSVGFDKRKQTLTLPFIAVSYTPLCNPLIFRRFKS